MKTTITQGIKCFKYWPLLFVHLALVIPISEAFAFPFSGAGGSVGSITINPDGTIDVEGSDGVPSNIPSVPSVGLGELVDALKAEGFSESEVLGNLGGIIGALQSEYSFLEFTYFPNLLPFDGLGVYIFPSNDRFETVYFTMEMNGGKRASITYYLFPLNILHPSENDHGYYYGSFLRVQDPLSDGGVPIFIPMGFSSVDQTALVNALLFEGFTDLEMSGKIDGFIGALDQTIKSLTVVPEPVTMFLVVPGLVGIAAFRRKVKRRVITPPQSGGLDS